MTGLRYNGFDVGTPQGVLVEQGPQFTPLARMKREPTMLVIHETVTRSAETTFRILKKRGLEIPLVGPPEGGLVQHCDLMDLAEHSGGVRNPIAIGLEVVNPYYPRLLPKKNSPWTNVIAAPWAHEDQYVLPTRAQAEACSRWIEFATTPGSPIGIPREWPGLDLAKGRMLMNRVKAPLRRGIVAHTYFGHADGAWLVLYAWLRIEAKLPMESAYFQAGLRATGVRTVDLRDYLSRPA